jgi:hypothetical protein
LSLAKPVAFRFCFDFSIWISFYMMVCQCCLWA